MPVSYACSPATARRASSTRAGCNASNSAATSYGGTGTLDDTWGDLVEDTENALSSPIATVRKYDGANCTATYIGDDAQTGPAIRIDGVVRIGNTVRIEMVQNGRVLWISEQVTIGCNGGEMCGLPASVELPVYLGIDDSASPAGGNSEYYGGIAILSLQNSPAI